MNADLRQQILVSLRAEGVGEADKLREAMARIKEEMDNAARGFVSGTMTFEELRKETGRLGTAFTFCTQLLKEFETQVEAVDVGLHKLQMTAIKFGDDLRGGFEKSLGTPAKIAKEVSDASDRINAALAEENAAFQRHAAVVIEAETEIERLQARATASMTGQLIANETARTNNAKATMLEANAQQFATEVLAEGAAMEATATAAVVLNAQAHGQAMLAAERHDAFVKKMSFTILAAGHAFQDLTSAGDDWVRGLQSTLNNIPLLATGLAEIAGASTSTAMAWAGGLTIVGAGAMSLYQNWGKLTDALGMGIPRPVLDSTKELETDLKAASKEFAELGNQTHLSLDELVRYEALQKKIHDLEEKKRLGSEWERLGKAESKGSREAGQGVIEAVAETGGRDEAMTAIYDALYNVGVKTGQEFTIEGLKAQAQTMLSDAARGDQHSADARNQIVNLLKNFGSKDSPLAKALVDTSPEEKKAKQDQAEKDREFVAEMKADQDADDDLKKQGEKEVREKLAAEKKDVAANKKVLSAHQQAVNRAASTFGGPLGQAQGPGSMTDAIIGRAGAGQSDAQISAGLGGHMRNELKGKVADDLVDEVADKIISDATAKVRAQATAGGGFEALDAGRQEKFGRAGVAAQKRVVREGNEGLAASIGEDMNANGAGMSPQVAQQAGNQAVRLMQQGFDYQQATMMAFTSVMADIAAAGQRMQQQNMAIMQGLNGVRAQVRGGQGQRPGLLQQFPQ